MSVVERPEHADRLRVAEQLHLVRRARHAIDVAGGRLGRFVGHVSLTVRTFSQGLFHPGSDLDQTVFSSMKQGAPAAPITVARYFMDHRHLLLEGTGLK